MHTNITLLGLGLELGLLLLLALLAACAATLGDSGTEWANLTVESCCTSSPMMTSTPTNAPSQFVTTPLTETPHLPLTRTPAPPAALTDFPLDLNNTWVYSFTYCERSGKNDTVISSTHVVTDKVIDTRSTSSYFAAEVERTIEWVSGVSTEEFENASAKPTSRHYWYVYVVEDNAVYRLHSPDFSRAWQNGFLLYKLPLASQTQCWYNLPGAPTVSPEAYGCSGWGYRYVDGPAEVTVPAGTFTPCYRVHQVYRGVGSHEWLCPNVGITKIEWSFTGDLYQPEASYEQLLISYSIQAP